MVSHIVSSGSKQDKSRKKNGAAENNHQLCTRQLLRMELKSNTKDAKIYEKTKKLLENEKKAMELRKEKMKLLNEMLRSTKPKEIKNRHSNEEEEVFKFLNRDAMTHLNERKWWNGKGSNNKCLRCKEIVGSSPEARKTHYKQDHFKVFYTLHRHSQSASVTEKWLLVHLGEERNAPRICCCCDPCDKFDEEKEYFAGRLALLQHIFRTHPRGLNSRKDGYEKVVLSTGVSAVDDSIHRILKTKKVDDFLRDLPS